MDIVQVIGAISAFVAAVLAPWLLYKREQAKLQHDIQRAAVSHESTLWERMASMVDRYGTRAEALEAEVQQLRGRLDTTEQHAKDLDRTIGELQNEVRRWRSFSIALMRQLKSEGFTPLTPESFGLDSNSDEDKS